MAAIKQENNISELTCVFDKNGNVVAEGKLITTFKTHLHELVERTRHYILNTLVWRASGGEINSEAWQLVACYLALYNIQLTAKPKPETSKEGCKQYAFFVSHGNPRAMRGFKLPVEAGDGYFRLPDAFRLLLTRTFEENKHLLIYPGPLDYANFNASSVDEPPLGTNEAMTVRSHIAQPAK
ncbi:Hypothetical protein GL50581_180 [Giardia duodenalis ATCC 50581]|uniref:Uncharacterized protein n=1 Tax=Giardia intestinalis (strain ATCC 50581 / GS clone H7) TaxID=598745 RepID=C6LN78_GIAIB|nr:Hypothetical protein GL50581_180 [Giardia intestinalis ATCC 50581]